MKKTAIILSAILAGAMAAPTAASAKNQYPQFPEPLHHGEEYTEEELAEHEAKFAAAEKELLRAYLNGEYDWDFNFDGKYDIYDAWTICQRYVEYSVGEERNDFTIDFLDKETGLSKKVHLPFTPEMRAMVDEEGDIDGDGHITPMDASKMLKTFYSVKQQGDVNDDGRLDAKDASKILTFYSNNSVNIQSDYETEKNMQYLGDLNGDGKVDASDASCILAEYTKLSTE